MAEIEGGPSPNPPLQFSHMFQKFALAFKSKTYELFAEEESSAAADADLFTLLDSAEESIPDLKVVVIKPDPSSGPNSSPSLLLRSLIPSLFATLSSFEASYLQFQTAHVPEIEEKALEVADRSLVAILQKLSEMRGFYARKIRGLSCDFEFPAGSFLEFQVQENQSKLRALEIMVNSLQSQIDVKDDEVKVLKKKLEKLRVLNDDLSRKLGLKEGKMSSGIEVLLTVRVFEAMLSDSLKLVRFFSKQLIDLMKRVGWDLEMAANSVYSGLDYSKTEHFRYVFLSYICLGMFQNFDKSDFGLCDIEPMRNENGIKYSGSGVSNSENSFYLKQLIEHVSSNPREILVKDPKCEFSQFCEMKYEELIHPKMECSIFSKLDGKEKVLDSWKSLSIFYESFVRMASSIWLLQKLAYSFSPTVEIFQVERGAEFSIVYMEDILGKSSFPGKTMPLVGFTVVPGFKVGKTVIQSQVYLMSQKCNGL
ncbi:protein GRAVITROPIC IN THE LIGHT 1 [Primulina tabacum]|uniref:protein GRAVITROPIC IN THE LIGHT 1 n=1 Tax=Primulina tabacum TaxID=48773 RepID=UPI003F5994C2